MALLSVPEIGLGISSPTTDASDTTESDADVETSTAAPIAIVAKKASVKSVTDGSVRLAPIENLVCPIPHTEGREVVNSVIPTDVDTLFTMLFTNSKFFLDLHTARKTFGTLQIAATYPYKS